MFPHIDELKKFVRAASASRRSEVNSLESKLIGNDTKEAKSPSNREVEETPLSSPEDRSLAASLLSAKAFGFTREMCREKTRGEAFSGTAAAAALKALGILKLTGKQSTCVRNEGSREEKSHSSSNSRRGNKMRVNASEQNALHEENSDFEKSPACHIEQTTKPNVPPPLPLFRSKKDPSLPDGEVPPPHTGIDDVFLWPSPQHVDAMPSEPEIIVPPPENVYTEILKRTASRATHSKNVLNRVVFDSIEPSQYQRVMRERDIERAQKNASFAGTSGDVASTSAVARNNDISVGRPARRGNEPATMHSWYVPASPEDTVLVFESRFEGGNCRRAVQIFNDEYDIVLKTDINTNRHTQWFYFECRNTRAKRKYKFNVVNLLKSDSLYNQGMRPLLYSERLAKEKGVGWHRCGGDICYYQNNTTYGRTRRRSGDKSFYTFTFTTDLPFDHDTVYFAYCYPYSYTDLQRYLLDLEKDPIRAECVRRRTLCSTLAGNSCDLITITTFSGSDRSSHGGGDEEITKMQGRKGVVVTARVHPGESNASWMMKGFIDYLTGSSVDAKILRDNFIFKIVPMLNPDGVVVGNYRCSLAGIDLNRSYLNPSRKLHPTIFYCKQMIKRFAAEREVVLTVDLHGHSRKMNIFVYGCENRRSKQLHLRERVFPRMLWKNARVFSFKDSKFGVRKSKETTARVVIRREVGITNSYTMEASFAGADFGEHEGRHFTTKDLEQMGHYFCDTILDYCDPDQSKAHDTLREIEKLHGTLDSGESDVGSDSDWERSAPVSRKSKKMSRKHSGNVGRRRRRKKKPNSHAISASSSSSPAGTYLSAKEGLKSESSASGVVSSS
eukprot:g5554.t1